MHPDTRPILHIPTALSTGKEPHRRNFTTNSSSQQVVKHLDSISSFIFHFRIMPVAAKKTVPRPKRALMASATAESFDAA